MRKDTTRGRDVLAVHTICHTTVTRDTVTEVLDIESPLETRGEETTERRDEGRETGQNEEVELVRRIRDCREVVAQLRKSQHHTRVLVHS